MGSCSKVLTSSYGRGGVIGILLGDSHPLNQPNSVYGIIFYSIMIIMALLNNKIMCSIQFYMSLSSVIMSLYLAYILYFILEELCPLCVSTYAVNLILFITSWCKKRSIAAVSTKDNSRRWEATLPRNNQDFKKQI